MNSLPESELQLRPIQEDDCRVVFEWANDDSTRQSSFSPAQISWSEHKAWFAKRLHDNNCLFFIVLLGNTPIGQLRFERDLKHGEATVSIGLGAEFRKKSYGERALRLGLEKIFTSTDIKTVHAYIKPENLGSLKVFEKAGFLYEGIIMHNGHQAVHDICVKKT